MLGRTKHRRTFKNCSIYGRPTRESCAQQNLDHGAVTGAHRLGRLMVQKLASRFSGNSRMGLALTITRRRVLNGIYSAYSLVQNLEALSISRISATGSEDSR